MEIVKESQSAEFTATTSLEYVDLGDDLSVFRLTRNMERQGPVPRLLQHTLAHSVSEGFTSTAGLREYFAGEGRFPPTSQRVRVVPANFLKAVAEYGFSDGYQKAAEEDKDFEDTRPFTALVQNHVSLDRVIFIETGSHMLFDRLGNVLPAGIHFDYIEAGMDNAHYDLARALEILKQNNRVRFYDRYGNKEDAPEILDVESYNASRLRSRYLAFWFEPTVEEKRALWEKQKSYATKYPSTEEHRAIFDLDILGLRAGGAAYYDDFHKSREYDDAFKSSSDDDH